MIEILTIKKLGGKIIICLAILVAVMLLCAAIGSQDISLSKVLAGPDKVTGQNIDYEIFVNVRLPRVLLAAMVGAALACAGTTFQAILRNPLADPYILGISSGAGLGAIIAILSGISWTLLGGSPVAVCAFIGSITTIWVVWYIGHLTGKSQVTSLLLAGVVVNAFISAIIMLLISTAKSSQIQSTILWLMGNITEKSPSLLLVSAFIMALGIILLMSQSKNLNILTFGEEQARFAGVNTLLTKMLSFGSAALITSIAVSLSGLVGFVGLIVPHIVRLIFGPDHRVILPLSAITGAILLVISDTIARTVISPSELPVGVITAIMGGPFFLVLLARYTRKVSFLK